MIPLDKLLSAGAGSPYYTKEDKAGIFYAESWALTHYLYISDEMGHGKKLNDFVHLLQTGVEPDKAFQQAIGHPKQIEEGLFKYVRRFTFLGGVYKNTARMNERDFASKTLSTAETEAELGDFHGRSRHHDIARRLVEAAIKDDPKLGLAHESAGFLAFSEGKDDEAAQQFAQAYELDHQLYLSLFFKTMLSPRIASGAPADLESVYQTMLQVLSINRNFAPALIELARIGLLRGDLTAALAVARRAEQLEPSRAGYHIFSARIMQRMGHQLDAATIARYVAERWTGPDHDEAVEVWSSVPEDQRTGGEPLTLSLLPDTVSVEGTVKSATCGNKDHPFSLTLQKGDALLTFRGGEHGWMTGFSDTLWYGADHFSLCHHVENLRAVVRYRESKDKTFAGELAELELREDLPPSAPRQAQ